MKMRTPNNAGSTANRQSDSQTILNKTDLRQKPIFHIMLIIIVGLLVYSNTFNVPFHLDDNSNIVDNYKLRDLNNFWPPGGSRWFGFLTFAANYKLGGLNVIGYHIFNITIHILNTILVYYLVVLTFRTPYFKVSVVSVSVSNQPNPFNLSTFQPFNYLPLFIALFFVSHPIQTQAVTYISQRFASLATFFYLLSLVMYIKARLTLSLPLPPLSSASRLWRRGGGMGGGDYSKLLIHRLRSVLWYMASLISAILAMKTKEISFTLPFIIALYELSFFGKSPNYELSCIASENRAARSLNLKRFLYLLPFLSTLIIIPLSLIGPEFGIYKPEIDEGEKLRQLQLKEVTTLSKYEYLLTQFRVIVTYIRLLFFPINQNLDYDYPIYYSFLNPQVFLSFLFLFSIFSLGIYLLYRSSKKARSSLFIAHSKKVHSSLFVVHSNNKLPMSHELPATSHELPTISYERIIAFGIFWFFITLSVESSIIPIKDVIFEHRVYLTSAGFFLSIITSVFIIVNRVKDKWQKIEKIIITVLALLIIALSGATYARNIVWQDSITLWLDVVKKSPYKRSSDHTASIYYGLGQEYASKDRFDNAIEMFNKAISMKPGYAKAYYNIGLVYQQKGQLDKAIEMFSKTVSIDPYYADAYHAIGLVYVKKGQYNLAIEEFKKAIHAKPNFGVAYNYIGFSYYKKGQLKEAIENYTKAISINPNLAEPYNNRGIIYFELGQYDKAIEDYTKALSINPVFIEAYINRGNIHDNKGQIDKAIEDYNKAIGINPNHAEAYFNRGIVYSRINRSADAISDFQKACNLGSEIGCEVLKGMLLIKR